MTRANPNPSAADSTGGNGQSCQSYLLRLWQQDRSWLASLQDARTGERYGFKTLRDLFAFVEVKTEEVKE